MSRLARAASRLAAVLGMVTLSTGVLVSTGSVAALALAPAPTFAIPPGAVANDWWMNLSAGQRAAMVEGLKKEAVTAGRIPTGVKAGLGRFSAVVSAFAGGYWIGSQFVAATGNEPFDLFSLLEGDGPITWPEGMLPNGDMTETLPPGWLRGPRWLNDRADGNHPGGTVQHSLNTIEYVYPQDGPQGYGALAVTMHWTEQVAPVGDVSDLQWGYGTTGTQMQAFTKNGGTCQYTGFGQGYGQDLSIEVARGDPPTRTTWVSWSCRESDGGLGRWEADTTSSKFLPRYNDAESTIAVPFGNPDWHAGSGVPDPLRHWETRFHCTAPNGAAYNSKFVSAQFRETDAEIPLSPAAECLDPTHLLDRTELWQVQDEGDLLEVLISVWESEIGIEEWGATWPQCTTGTCKVELFYEVTPGVYATCHTAGAACANWQLADPKYQCRYAGTTIDNSECLAYKELFNPKPEGSPDPQPDPLPQPGECYGQMVDPITGECYPQPQPDPDPDPTGSPTPTTSPTIPPQEYPGGPGTPGDEGAACFPGGWQSLNPVEWVYRPIKCALTELFVPETSLQIRVERMGADIGTRAPFSWVSGTIAALGGGGVPGSGCPQWTVKVGGGYSTSVICDSGFSDAIVGFRPVLVAGGIAMAFMPLLRGLAYASFPVIKPTPSD